jgi:hypothetical protein
MTCKAFDWDRISSNSMRIPATWLLVADAISMEALA